MLLLTGATGLVGSALLRRLTAAGQPVRCLVRDPRRLGSDRVRVQIALGDLADPPSFRNALRGVRTVVHLAASIRDQRAGSIEELNGIATWRMVQAAERAGVEHFVFFSWLGASSHDRTRVLRAKALAEQAVLASDVRHTVFAPSLVYAPGDRLLTSLERMAMVLPAMPISGRGDALYQPIWVEDVADCVMNQLPLPPGAFGSGPEGHERFELTGPQTLSHREIVELVLRAAGRQRRLVSVPSPVVRGALRLGEMVMKSRTPVTWDEAELLQVSMTGADAAGDANGLRVRPRRMAEVLGLAAPGAAPPRAAPPGPGAAPRRQAGR